MNALERLANHVIYFACSERGYSGMFKAAVILVSAALLSLSQVGPFLYERDLAAHKLRYTLEATVGQPLENIDCRKPGPLKAECLVAKYEVFTLESTLVLFEAVVQFCLKVGGVLGLFSVLSFLFAPFIHRPTNQVPNPSIEML